MEQVHRRSGGCRLDIHIQKTKTLITSKLKGEVNNEHSNEETLEHVTGVTHLRNIIKDGRSEAEIKR